MPENKDDLEKYSLSYDEMRKFQTSNNPETVTISEPVVEPRHRLDDIVEQIDEGEMPAPGRAFGTHLREFVTEFRRALRLINGS